MFVTQTSANAIPIMRSTPDSLAFTLSQCGALAQTWAATQDYQAKPGQVAILPDVNGGIEAVVLGVGQPPDPWLAGKLASMLPEGTYQLAEDDDAEFLKMFALAWELGSFRYDRYSAKQAVKATFVLPNGVEAEALTVLRDSVYLVRELVSAPAQDMGPEDLADALKTQAEMHGAQYTEIVGDDLLKENYPMVHAVGRGSLRAPRLSQLFWGDEQHPKLTLVGKGVCFDTGGLDLKSAAGMRYMSKDMGGAAHVIALAGLIMSAKLPVRLRVIIPAVENAVSGNAYRPGDVLHTRKGITVEVGNTDAEGRLILGDTLYEAASESPDLLIDFATLTGACRIAMGPDLPAMFSSDDVVAHAVQAASERVYDPIWRLPLFKPYRKFLDSSLADLHNIQNEPGGYGSGITAALFLQAFVGDKTQWLHFDISAMNTRNLPGRPKGGEAFGLRAVFEYLKQRYADSA